MAMLVLQPGKGTILNRLQAILGRARDLKPLAEPVRKVLWDANKDRALKGLDFQGKPYAPLRPSTLKDRARKGYPAGPPLVREGESSRVIKGCVVTVTPEGGKLRFDKFFEAPYFEAHVTGTPRMAKRDPLGWGQAELSRVRAMLPAHVLAR